MNSLLISVLIGLLAGIIDVIPMIKTKQKKSSIVSALFHWLALGIIIPNIGFDITPALKGFLVAELLTLSMIIYVGSEDKEAILPMFIMSGILGAGVGYLNSLFN